MTLPSSWVRDRAKNESQAFDRYRQVLQRSLGCLTRAIWLSGPPLRGSGTRRLFLSADPLELKREAAPSLLLSASQHFHIEPWEGQYKVRTDGYIYRLASVQEPEGALLAWHWHPDVRPDPHVHANGHPDQHIPTGRVTLESVLAFLLADLHVKPRIAGWRETLSQTEELHKKYRTWA